MELPKATNAEIFAALQAMGIAPTMGPINPADLRGNQHGEFMRRMIDTFRIMPETFDRAETIARRIKEAQPRFRLDDPAWAQTITAIVREVDPEAKSLQQKIEVDPFSGAIRITQPTQPTWNPQQAPSPTAPKPAGAPPAAGSFAPNTPGSGSYIYRGEITGQPSQQKPAGGRPGGGGPTSMVGGGGGAVVNAAVNQVELPPALAANASEEQIREHVRKHYGFMSWGLDIPEIRQIVLDIAQNPSTKWTQEAVNGRVMSTGWWQQNGINVQTWLQRRANDPATTQQEILAKFQDFQAAAKAAGIEMPEQRLWDMAEEALKWKWSEQTIQAVLGSEYRYDPSKPTAISQNAKKLASDYLVPLSEQTVGWWTQQLVTGQKTEDEYKQYLIQQAKSMFPHLSAPLDRGEPLGVYLDSYKQRVASTLEQDPDQIDFTQPKWMRLLTRVDPKTGERSMMDLADVDQVIRTDPQYGYEYTKNARDEASNLASALMKKMGVTT